MATQTWIGGNGDWSTGANWVGGTAPQIGDDAIVSGGTVTMYGTKEPQPGSFDALTIDLGSATLDLAGATLGHFSEIDATGIGQVATLAAIGTAGIAANINDTAPDEQLTFQATGSSDLVLLYGAIITVGGSDTLSQLGRLEDNATELDVDSGGTLIVDGTITTSATALIVFAGGTIAGTGAIDIGMYSSFYLLAGSAPANIPVQFVDVGGRLILGTPSDYTGNVSNFQVGDIIDLATLTADYAYFDASSDTLTVRNGGSLGTIVASLNVQGPASSQVMSVTSNGAGGTYVAPAGSLPRTKYTITAADKALGSNVVRATMETPHGAPIDGTGIKIGIISDSFDAFPGIGVADPANQDAMNGYLPLAADGTTCAVTVLQDSQGGQDEGRAMAELVHQIAPGAQIDFYTGDTAADFAAGVSALAAAGCGIIVDDISNATEPYFQIGGAIEDAIQSAVSSGVSYFTAAGNYANASFSGNFAASNALTTLYDGSNVDAYIFSNGTPYQTITIPSQAIIYLQWDAPYPKPGDPAPPVELEIKVFDANHNLLTTSSQSAFSAGSTIPIPGVQTLVNGFVGATFQIAIYNPSGEPVPGTFKYVLRSGSGLGGVIDDPAAQQDGTVIGHAMLPDVNTVGASDFPNFPAYGNPAQFTEYFSSVGTGVYLFDPNGNRLASPQSANKVDFVAPDGAGTTVFAPFYGTSAAAPDAAAVAALMLQANPSLTPAQVTSMLKASAIGLGLPVAMQGAGLIQAPAAVQLALDAACFVEGTRIATEAGDVAVEYLRIGDRVLIADTAPPPPLLSPSQIEKEEGWVRDETIVAVHRRTIDCTRHPSPRRVWPLCINAGAFAPRQPCRDLWLSPDHAVFIDGVLIPMKHLINGTSIQQIAVDRVTYFHLELPHHHVVCAEALPVESYLDIDSVGDFAAREREAQACAPLVVAGPALAAIRLMLASRADYSKVSEISSSALS